MATAQQERHVPPPRPPLPQVLSHQSVHQIITPMQDSTTHIWSYKDLRKVYDMAYRLVDAGLKADEKDNLEEASTSYTESLHLLDKALRVDCERLSQSNADQINQAKEMQLKMNKTRQQISYRLQTIQAKQGNTCNNQPMRAEPTAPPSYDEAISEPPSLPPSYDDELTALGESLMHREISNSSLANAEELFTIPDEVQLFYISPDGYVSAPTYPTSLHIVRLIDESQRTNTTVFLHVGDWMYPLIPGASPALHTNYGAYLFPDVTDSRPGAAVGVMIPETVPLEMRQRFEDIIRSLTLYGEQTFPFSPSEDAHLSLATATITKETPEEIQEDTEELDTAGKISKGLLVAADWIAWGVSKGAEKAAVMIKQGSEKIQRKQTSSNHEHKIDPKVQNGVIYAREATSGAVKVSGYIVNKLGALTVALAKQVAPHVKKQGMKILPESMVTKNSNGKSTVDGVVEVAASGLKGFGTVYLSLESAAKSLGKCLANETVNIVTHKYGEEAGVLAENTLYTGGNVIMTAHNVNNMGAKSLAKRAVKETGKAVVIGPKNNQKDSCSKSTGSPVDSTQASRSNLVEKEALR